MAVIEKQLHEHFASLDDDEADASSATAFATTVQLPDSAPEVLDPPFAKVNSVVDGSPANRAGLKVGDLIRNFGYVNHENHDGLKKVGQCVQGNEGVSFHWQRHRCAGILRQTCGFIRLIFPAAKRAGQGCQK